VLICSVALISCVAVSGRAQMVDFSDGDLRVTTDGPAVGIFIGGPDITQFCASGFCNNDMQIGADGSTFTTLLGYSDGAFQTQWLFFNLASLSGVDLSNELIATGVPIDSDPSCNDYVISYAPDTGLDPVEGVVGNEFFCSEIQANDDDYDVVGISGTLDTLAQGLPGVLDNDDDLGVLVLAAELLDGPSHGDLTLASDGSFVYTHDGTDNLIDTFTYEASSVGFPARPDVATVTITIHVVPEPDSSWLLIVFFPWIAWRAGAR